MFLLSSLFCGFLLRRQALTDQTKLPFAIFLSSSSWGPPPLQLVVVVVVVAVAVVVLVLDVVVVCMMMKPGFQTILTREELATFQPQPSLLKKGEASFHHPLAVHGSYANRSVKATPSPNSRSCYTCPRKAGDKQLIRCRYKPISPQSIGTDFMGHFYTAIW